MKTLLTTVLILSILSSCGKKDYTTLPQPGPVVPPAMRYTDLSDSKIAFGNFKAMDLDGNGTADFSISTTLVGSPADQSDYKRYYFNGGFFSYSPVDENEQMPVLARGEKIGEKIFPNHEWYNASQLLLSQLVIPTVGQPFWNGVWMDANHRYVAISIMKEEKMYYGWVELSFDKYQGNVVLHNAAISLEPGRDVKAGF